MTREIMKRKKRGPESGAVERTVTEQAGLFKKIAPLSLVELRLRGNLLQVSAI